ncbi:unnamed protein product [Blepharisma stoltei]|uniref:CCT domain-containing protein n=1 Tax=Blepharisma stoltei TaxID=1481888 RepID=A0AAU9JT04_9CILI|nr:unnamed protein product [Blepharisma stoltei]
MFDPSMFISDRDTNDTDGHEQPFLPPDFQQFFVPNIQYDTENPDIAKKEDASESLFMPHPDVDNFDPSVFFNFDPGFMQPDSQEIRRLISQPFDYFSMISSEQGENKNNNKDKQVKKYENNLLPKPKTIWSQSKKIGTLSYEERREKIMKYLEKRKRRNYNKKIAYACRKRVADDRIRVKGRFVTKVQAEALKGLQNEKNNVSLPIKRDWDKIMNS